MSDKEQPQKTKDENQPTPQEIEATFKRAEAKRLDALGRFYANTARIYREIADRR